MKRVLALLGTLVARILLAVPALLAFGALAAPGGTVSMIVSGLFAAAALCVLILLRPLWKSAAATLGMFGIVLVWFSCQTPRLDREWQPDVARAPRVSWNGDVVTIRDVRDFDWTSASAGNPRWTDRTLDASKLDSVWLALSYWDGNTAICHTMLSFGFTDGQHLAVSVEARKEVGEEYSAWRGFFHQFELLYVIAEERDVFGVRAAHRGEDLRLYELRLDAPERRRLFDDLLATAHSLGETPEWYGAMRRNCTTTLQSHLDVALGRAPQFHFDTLLNGDIDEVAWRRGKLTDERPFPEVRAAHRITDAARAAAGRPDFPRVVRESIRTR